MKSVLKEILILVILTIVIFLILGVVLYNYSPYKITIPSKVSQYTTPENVKNEIDDEIVEYPKQNIVFEITDEDLTLYRKVKSYNPGKANPFADETNTVDGNIDKNTVSGNTGTSQGTKNSISAEQKASSKIESTSLK